MIILAKLNQIRFVFKLVQLYVVAQEAWLPRVELHLPEDRLSDNFLVSVLLRVEDFLSVEDSHLERRAEVLKLLFRIVNAVFVDRKSGRVHFLVLVIARTQYKAEGSIVLIARVPEDLERILVTPVNAKHATVLIRPHIGELLLLAGDDGVELGVILIRAHVVIQDILVVLASLDSAISDDPSNVLRVHLDLLVNNAFKREGEPELVLVQVHRILRREVRADGVR